MSISRSQCLLLASLLLSLLAGAAPAGRMELINGRAALPLLGPAECGGAALEQREPLATDFQIIPPRSDRFSRRETALMKTRAWVALGPDHLVVHFLCLDPAMKDAVPPKTKKRPDAQVWNDDYVDVAIDSNNDKETYFYLAANRNGALWDSACEPPFKVNQGWDSDAVVETLDREDGWTVTLRIPLSLLGMRPGGGDIISFSFGRSKLFNKTALMAALPEDAIAIDYEQKLQKSKMREESSTTPFSVFNWYFQQRKMLFPANFLETVVSGAKATRPVTVVCTTRGTLRPEKYPWNNRFVAFVQNTGGKKQRIEAVVTVNGKSIAQQKVEAAPQERAFINLVYPMQSDEASYAFHISANGKTIYKSVYRTLPVQLNLKQPMPGNFNESLMVKQVASRTLGGMYYPHQLDYAPGTPRGVRYGNLLGFGIQHNMDKLLRDIASHRVLPLMMWKRPGKNTYNELSLFADAFRTHGIQCFLGPHAGVTYDHERKQLFTTDGTSSDIPVINGRVYVLAPAARAAIVKNLRDAFAHAGDLIKAINILDEGEAWLAHMIQDIVWKYREDYPDLASEIANEVKYTYGFGKYGVPERGDKDPFKRLALRRYLSDKLMEFGKELGDAARAINPDVLVCANDDTHGFCWLGAANYKGVFDIAPHQLNNFHTMPGKCEAELKYLVDVSGVEVWPFPHIEGWADPAETREALSEVFRSGCSGLMMYNVSGFKYSTHDCWNAPARFAAENRLADLFAEGYRIKQPERCDVAVVMSVDSQRAYHRSRAGHSHRLIGPGTGAWYRFVDEDLIELGRANLEALKFIIVPYAPIMRKAAVEKLVAAARNGATLVLQDDSFQFDLDGTELSAIRKQLLGAAVPAERGRLNGKEYFSVVSERATQTLKTLKPLSSSGAAFTHYGGTIEKPLLLDEKQRVVAWSCSFGKGRIIWLGYCPFNYRDAVDTDWQTFFRSMFEAEGIRTDEPIWKFMLESVPVEAPEDGICLTGNACRWEHNRPRLWQNFPGGVRYTYDQFPNAMPDCADSGWIDSSNGHLTDKLKRFQEVIGCTNPSRQTLANWMVAWKDVQGTYITFDLGQEWEISMASILFAENQSDLTVSTSSDGTQFTHVAAVAAKGALPGSIREVIRLGRHSARFIRFTLENMPAETETIIAEIEIWVTSFGRHNHGLDTFNQSTYQE